MKRPQLFSRVLSLMFRSGALWLVALAVAVVDVIISLLLPSSDFVPLLARTLLEAVTAAFLAGALISLVNSLAEGQAVGAGDGFTAGARTFLPLLILGLILAIPIWLMTQLLDVVMTPYYATYLNDFRSADPNTVTSAVAQAGLLVCCLVPLMLLAVALVAGFTSVISVGAQRAIALEGQAVGASFKRAWGLLRSRFTDYLVIGLIMLGILAAVAILFGCPAILIITLASGIAVSPGNVAASFFSSTTMITIVISILGIPITILFSGVWTLAFRYWQGKDTASTALAQFPPVEPEQPLQP